MVYDKNTSRKHDIKAKIVLCRSIFGLGCKNVSVSQLAGWQAGMVWHVSKASYEKERGLTKF